MDIEEPKKYGLKCDNCKVSYSIKYDKDETDMRPMSCPFCSYELDGDEDEIIEGDEDETSWD